MKYVAAALGLVVVGMVGWAVWAFVPWQHQLAKPTERMLDAPYVPTPPEVVDRMLEVAKVTKNDLVYDLGCGDARIPIAAAKKYGCRGVGVENDVVAVTDARANVKKNHVEKLVTIKEGDLFKEDVSQATVVGLYLLPGMNRQLIPQLQKMKPGSRVVCHDFDMEGEADPDHVEKMTLADGSVHTIYLYIIPLHKAGQPLSGAGQ
jgi:precorrin-6B methylase 2